MMLIVHDKDDSSVSGAYYLYKMVKVSRENNMPLIEEFECEGSESGKKHKGSVLMRLPGFGSDNCPYLTRR